MTTTDEYNYWMERKTAYQNNLDNNVGCSRSIKALLVKINQKLDSLCITTN